MADSEEEKQVAPSGLLDNESDEEDEEPRMSQEDLDKGLLQAVKDNNLEKVTEFLGL